MTSQLYQEPLDKLGISWEAITDDSLGKKLDEELFKVMQGDDDQRGKQLAIELINHLRGKKVDDIIIACTELPLMLKDYTFAKDLINPTQLLAEAAVLYSINK